MSSRIEIVCFIPRSEWRDEYGHLCRGDRAVHVTSARGWRNVLAEARVARAWTRRNDYRDARFALLREADGSYNESDCCMGGLGGDGP